MIVVDQEVRGQIALIADLLDRFDRCTELCEEELWARSERLVESSQLMCLMEPMEARLANLEKQV